MELSELTAYAEEKFHMKEQHKWADLPGCSVLADTHTGKWVALLMRQWDFDTGTEIQRCDIKCGQETLSEIKAPYLSLPFRMKDRKWIGVCFDNRTDPKIIFRLFDQAVYSCQDRGYTIVLDDRPTATSTVYADTPLPSDRAGVSYASTDLPVSGPNKGIPIFGPNRGVPERIRQMLSLYRPGGSSFKEKCRIFYRQAKFMEDYEDDLKWTGEYSRYFPTYHDLNIRQLRGYFSWRAHVRKGEFLPIPLSLAYMYLYELLNGIGTASPEDGLKKMKAFETGFLDAGLGDPVMRKNLRRWMLEFGVIHHIDAALIREYADPEIMERDRALWVLKNPEECEDEAVFASLCTFAGKKLEQSPLAGMEDGTGKHLFARVWRHILGTYDQQGMDFFTACFGGPRAFPWYPMANAIYWQPQVHPDDEYMLDECRSYTCRNGVWKEVRYDKLYFDTNKLRAFLHETERRLRKYLKTGHYLRQNPAEAWAGEYVEAVIKAWEQEKLKAMQPKITINLSDLDQIRQDARVTRDSLLTEDEMDEAGETAPDKGTDLEVILPAAGEPAKERPLEPDAVAVPEAFSDFMDPVYMKLLLALLQGDSGKAYIKEHHLMPSVAADAINEALFDEIGDNVLECDGENITLVQDYKEDVLQMLGGKNT